MPETPIEVHIIADSTGDTAARVARAVAAQYAGYDVRIILHPRQTSADGLHDAFGRMHADRVRTVVFSTVVDGTQEQPSPAQPPGITVAPTPTASPTPTPSPTPTATPTKTPKPQGSTGPTAEPPPAACRLGRPRRSCCYVVPSSGAIAQSVRAHP